LLPSYLQLKPLSFCFCIALRGEADAVNKGGDRGEAVDDGRIEKYGQNLLSAESKPVPILCEAAFLLRDKTKLSNQFVRQSAKF
jgi:hypothetical protein